VKIAIDLDNTILDYSSTYSLALKDLDLHKEINHKLSKEEIKNIIKDDSKLGNDVWIEFQGLCYGKYISEARFFPHAVDAINSLKEDFEVEIVSHKTKTSLCGKYSLVELARERLEKEITEVQFTFHEKIEDKIKYINSNFNIVIDDLEKVMDLINESIVKILFGKSKRHFSVPNWRTISSFLDILKDNTPFKILSTSRSTVLIETKKQKKIFKTYSQSDRYKREKDALVVLSKDLLSPKIVAEYENMMEFEFHGHESTKSFNSDIISLYSSVINQLRHSNYSYSVTHRSKDLYGYIENIKNRAMDLHNFSRKNELIEKLDNLTSSSENTKLGTDICIPDFSKENVLSTSNGYLLIDFESSGVGSPERTFLNIIHHPKNDLNEEEFKMILREFKELYDKEFCLKKVRELFDLNALEWCIIIYSYDKNEGEKVLNAYLANNSKSWKSNLYELLKKEIA
jgi:hypothetical protein